MVLLYTSAQLLTIWLLMVYMMMEMLRQCFIVMEADLGNDNNDAVWLFASMSD